MRISVGGPAENAFTAAVLDDADEAYRVELDKQLATSSGARVWVPASRGLRDVWQPSADLTGVLDLPVLIVVGAEEVAAVAADLGDAVIDVTQHADAATSNEPALDDYTVAVLNTGMPSFAVDSDGGLNLSVLRSCTGWPSGVWIDPPRRSAPDGSNFQQQHWTHHFDYALLTGSGDWRDTELVRAGHELNHPLHHSSTTSRGGGLAETTRYLALDSDVLVTAVKAAGNPLADGIAPAPVTALTMRLVEPRGATTSCTISTSFAITDAAATDLLERPTGDAAPSVSDDRIALDLTPMAIRTVRLGVTATGDDGPVLGAAVEPHQPVYSRYWLNNSGPAPRGNLPVTVHLEPPVVDWADGDEAFELTVLVSSDRTDGAVDVPVQLVLPDGWQASVAQFAVTVEPGAYAEQAVQVMPTASVADGTWWVRAQATVGDQVVEDVTRVLSGAQSEPELSVAVRSPGPLAPGDQATVEVIVTSAARTDVAAQVQLISPWHTWELLPEWNTGVAVPAGGQATVSLPVVVPLESVSGSWWLLVKVAAAGRLHYSEPAELSVLAR